MTSEIPEESVTNLFHKKEKKVKHYSTAPIDFKKIPQVFNPKSPNQKKEIKVEMDIIKVEQDLHSAQNEMREIEHDV